MGGEGVGRAERGGRRKEKGERRKEKGGRRKEDGGRRKEKGERRKEKGEGRREKGEGRREKGEGRNGVLEMDYQNIETINMSGMAAKGLKDLFVWRKAHQFVYQIYSFTEGFPKSEMPGLALQLRMAAISFQASIAEGVQKRSRHHKLKLLHTAQKSLEECRFCLQRARELNYGGDNLLSDDIEGISKLLESYNHAILANAS